MGVGMDTVELRPHAGFPERHRGSPVAAATVDCAGRALWLVWPPDDGPRVAVAQNGTDWDVPLTGLDHRPDLIDALPDGGFLTVDVRVDQARPGLQPAHNARVFGADGGIVRSFRIGDGVEHALTDRHGTLWTGYFDEGVFGDPLSAPGLARWSAGGDRLWSFSPVSGADYIADCYTLNVDQDAVWACTWTGFPLIELRDQRVYRVRGNQVSGPSAVAVRGDRAVFLGGYGETAAGRLTYCRLGLDSVVEEAVGRLLMPDGRAVADAAHPRRVTRGGSVYLRDRETQHWSVYRIPR